ncbi:MAG: acyl carrier protein [Lachnospiraceae bacterium]|nr:acyl carrier protein [Lachnospiraceae bacterium]
MEEKLYAILSELRPEFNFRESSNYVEDGYLDSFDIVTLVSAIEKEFGIVVNGLDILPENFESVKAISALINKGENK